MKLIQEQLNVVNSIEDAIGPLGRDFCPKCKENGRYVKFSDVLNEGRYAVYRCPNLPVYHDFKVLLEFETPSRDIDMLAEQIKAVGKNISKENSGSCNRGIQRELDGLYRQLRLYARFANPSFQMEFPAKCSLCGDENKVLVENQKVEEICGHQKRWGF